MRLDRDLKYNQDRYYDPTAQKAISSADSANPGELWWMEFKSYSAFVLILAKHDDVLTFLRLQDNTNDKNDLVINCQGVKHTSSYMIQYGFEDNAVYKEFVRTMKSAEYQRIKSAVYKSLGFDGLCEREPNVKATEGTVKEAPDEIAKLEARLYAYRDLFSVVVERLIEKGGVDASYLAEKIGGAK